MAKSFSKINLYIFPISKCAEPLYGFNFVHLMNASKACLYDFKALYDSPR